MLGHHTLTPSLHMGFLAGMDYMLLLPTFLCTHAQLQQNKFCVSGMLLVIFRDYEVYSL